jgi:hypothetical protein
MDALSIAIAPLVPGQGKDHWSPYFQFVKTTMNTPFRILSEPYEDVCLNRECANRHMFTPDQLRKIAIFRTLRIAALVLAAGLLGRLLL